MAVLGFLLDAFLDRLLRFLFLLSGGKSAWVFRRPLGDLHLQPGLLQIAGNLHGVDADGGVKGVVDEVLFAPKLKIEDVVAADKTDRHAVARSTDALIDRVSLQRVEVRLSEWSRFAADFKSFPGSASLEKTHQQSSFRTPFFAPRKVVAFRSAKGRVP